MHIATNKMPKVQRSPPPTPKPDIPKKNQPCTETESERITGQSSEDDIQTRKVTNRRKRTRVEYTPPNCECTNGNEIKEMLLSMQKQQESTLSSMSKDISELKSQNNRIEKTNLEIEKFIELVNRDFEDMRKKIDFLEHDREQKLKHIANLETKILDLELRSRSASIEIRNIPPQANETATHLSSILGKICSATNANIQTTEIRDIYRVIGRPGPTRTIVAEFNSVQTKEKMLSSVSAFNKNKSREMKLNSSTIGLTGEINPIFVAEYLMPSTKRLFFKAREFAKAQNYRFCWTSNEKVFLRKENGLKLHRVKDEQTLADLTNLA